MPFLEDLRYGKKYEELALQYIDYDTYSFNNTKEYDIEICFKGAFIRYEVKRDRLADKTGNVAIEFNYNNRDSGLNSTTADYWILFVKDDCYIVPVEELRKLTKDCRIVKGGDGYKSRMYLLKYDTLNKYIVSKK